jgi:hypothetical protein
MEHGKVESIILEALPSAAIVFVVTFMLFLLAFALADPLSEPRLRRRRRGSRTRMFLEAAHSDYSQEHEKLQAIRSALSPSTSGSSRVCMPLALREIDDDVLPTVKRSDQSGGSLPRVCFGSANECSFTTSESCLNYSCEHDTIREWVDLSCLRVRGARQLAHARMLRTDGFLVQSVTEQRSFNLKRTRHHRLRMDSRDCRSCPALFAVQEEESMQGSSVSSSRAASTISSWTSSVVSSWTTSHT